MHKKTKNKINLITITLLLICSVIFSAIFIAPYTNINENFMYIFSFLGSPISTAKTVLEINENETLAPVQTAPHIEVPIENENNSDYLPNEIWNPLPQNTEEITIEEMPQTEQTLPQTNENDGYIEYHTQNPTPITQNPPQQIPQGTVAIQAKLYENAKGGNYIQTGTASIINYTELSSDFIQQYVDNPLPFEIELNSDLPQVLIMHTHGTETFELENEYYTDPNFTARSTNSDINVTSLGAIIAAELNYSGINTLHDASLHDYPSYNGSYERSHQNVSEYLAMYPSIKVVIDVHRDALQSSDGTRIKPVAEINGQNTAQVMIICGADLNGNLPNFTENLKFAALWQANLEGMYPGLTRPVLFDYRYYNQDLTTGSLLLEIGGHANTLKEAQNATYLAADALVKTLIGY